MGVSLIPLRGLALWEGYMGWLGVGESLHGPPLKRVEEVSDGNVRKDRKKINGGPQVTGYSSPSIQDDPTSVRRYRNDTCNEGHG